MRGRQKTKGFTLIELSIVLVIIGLIIGGVLFGVDMIRAAGVRSQISQIEKYNTATKTFRLKYGYLPGDIPEPSASAFGFKARGIYPGEGDGNGVLDSVWQNSAVGLCSGCQSAGEIPLFWVDLSTAQLIDGNFTTATAATVPVSAITGASIASYLPSAKIGQGNYITVYNFYLNGGMGMGTNYYGISLITQINAGAGTLLATPGISAQQAYGIDVKIDDGMPQPGTVLAQYQNTPVLPNMWIYWAGGAVVGAAYTTATPASATSCFDNGNSAGATQQYSLAQSSGNAINCALAFKFQ